jgi:ribulose 1,5-bisphosphate synthetase/thiazole synthase
LLLARVTAGFDFRRAAESATVISDAKDVQTSYDYVIVGGGTAGLTVADRLTEDGKTTVLVVEHGKLGTVASSEFFCVLG